MDGLLGRALSHPATRGLDLDAPETTSLRRQLILDKPFLKEVYLDWYRRIRERIPSGSGEVIEIGAGGGFLEQEIPGLVKTEIFWIPHLDLVADAQALPFADGSLKAITMTNVFHHLPDVARFLSEAERTLRVGGRVIMVEPWNTGWSRFVHEKFHDEPMLPETTAWEFPSSGPLSGANAALAWVVTERDRNRLEHDWGFRVTTAEPFMPLRYLASGGVSLRSLQPRWSYPLWERLDEIPVLKRRMSVFALIELEREP